MATQLEQKKNEKLDKINEWKSNKIELANDFFDIENTVKDIKIKKWEIYNCLLGENIGHEQNNERPVLILSSDFYNSNTSTVTIAPLSKTIVTKEITKNGRRRRVLKFSSQYRLHRKQFDFLRVDSVVKFDQLKTICKTRLTNRLGEITVENIQKDLNKKLMKYLDL